MSSSKDKELFNLSLVDLKRKKKIAVQLEDKDGNEVSVADITEKLYDYVVKKIANPDETFIREQVFPLMVSTLTVGLTKALGGSSAAVLLGQSDIRSTLTEMMTVGFLFYRYIQQEGLKINALEEALSDEQVDAYLRIDNISSTAIAALGLGLDPEEVVQEMMKDGLLKDEDLEELGYPKDHTFPDLTIGKKSDKKGGDNN